MGEDIIGQPQRWWFLPILVIAWFGAATVYGAISGASIPKLLVVLDPGSKDTNLAVVAGVGGAVVMLVTPLFGRLSDRTTSRWVMRKPWIAGGLLIGTFGVAVLSVANNVLWLAVGWAVVQIGYGAVQMVQHTLLADQVPARIRARAAGAVGAAGAIAGAASAAIIASLPFNERWSWFAVPGAIGLVLVAPMLIGYRDAVRMAPGPPLSAREILRTYWLKPPQYCDFAWAWCSRFFMTLSILAITLFFFFVLDTLGYTPQEAGHVQATAGLFSLTGSLISTAIFGWISDRVGRRKVFVWTSGLLSATGITVIMVSGTLSGFLAGIAIIGFAQGVYIAVDVALMTEVLPSASDAGKDLGIVALSYQLPQVLSPLVGAAAIRFAGGDYSVLFAFSVICSVVGGLAVMPVRSVR